MNSGDSSFSGRQLIGGGRIEGCDDHALMLNGFCVVEWRFVEGSGIASFNADDFGDAVGGGEFELIGSQRRIFGIDEDVHCAKASAAFLTRRLLCAKRRWREEYR